jgi:hypothetical protein
MPYGIRAVIRLSYVRAGRNHYYGPRVRQHLLQGPLKIIADGIKLEFPIFALIAYTDGCCIFGRINIMAVF